MSLLAPDQEPTPRPRSRSDTGIAIVLLSLVVGGGGGFLVSRVLEHIERLNTRIDTLEQNLHRSVDDAEAATQHAVEAERTARDAAGSQLQAEEDAELARRQAASADQRATLAVERAAAAQVSSLEAQEEAILAREQADATRRVAEAEMNRLTDALNRIAETRRTALGLVMSLDEGYLKFDTDKAALRAESREILSRIAGILFTAGDFAITISGHTDARGAGEYNQQLSERRAQAVADYLIAAGVSSKRFTVQGLGESQPLDPGGDDEAHAKNRRVELGIVNARIIDHTQLEREAVR